MRVVGLGRVSVGAVFFFFFLNTTNSCPAMMDSWRESHLMTRQNKNVGRYNGNCFVVSLRVDALHTAKSTPTVAVPSRQPGCFFAAFAFLRLCLFVCPKGVLQSKAVRLSDSMDVLFIPREVLFRVFPGGCLPRFQEIKQDLMVRNVTALDIVNQTLNDVVVVSHRLVLVTSRFFPCGGVFFCIQQCAVFPLASSVLLVSSRLAFSRWLSPDNPDVTGEQLTAIRSFLNRNEWVEFIWFDFCSLPQGERNLAETTHFRAALKFINLLYLHAPVLILLDANYQTRFWCLYETFLATHKFDGALVPEGSWTLSGSPHPPPLFTQFATCDNKSSRACVPSEVLLLLFCAGIHRIGGGVLQCFSWKNLSLCLSCASLRAFAILGG